MLSLRDIAVTIIVLGALPMALRHPYVGVMLWTWISIMNPHKLAWGFAYNAPFAALAAGVTLIALFSTKDKVKLGNDPIVVALIVFLAWTAFTTLFAFNQAESISQLNKVFKIQLMTLVAVAVLHQREHLQLFVWVNVISLGFYGFKGGLYTLETGGSGRVWGPPGGFIEGNNELALALIMTVPLMYYLRHTSTNKWVRHGLLLTMALSAASALGTQSRGALLAIVAMGAVLWWRSANRFVTLIPIAIVGIALALFMPDTWHDRMATIKTYEQDNSAMGRINTWHIMTNIANDRFTGGGFATYEQDIFRKYQVGDGKVRAAHSIYFQALGEHGWLGLVLFMVIWILGWFKASRIRRKARDPANPDPQMAMLAGMCQVSLVGFAVGGAFLSLAYFDLPYNILVMLIVASRVIGQVDTQKAPATAVAMGRRFGGSPRFGARPQASRR